MLLSPSPLHEQLCAGWSRAVPRSGNSKSLETEHLQAPSLIRKRTRQATYIAWEREEGEEDGRRPASTPTVTFFGERRCLKPRLERQGAFRAPQTWDVSDMGVQLYRLGILYDENDDDHSRDKRKYVHGPSFCSNALVSPRPTKRAKRTHNRQLSREGVQNPSMNLLSIYLSDGAATPRFITRLDDEEPASLRRGGFEVTNVRYKSLKVRGHLGPLSIIHELAEDLTHSPALCAPASDLPDLVPDTEEGCGGCDDDEDDNIFDADWTLPGSESSASPPGAEVVWLDADVDVATDGRGEMADADGGAWVFFAGDDS